MNDGYLNLFLFQIILQIKVRWSIQRNRGGWGGVCEVWEVTYTVSLIIIREFKI